MQDLLGWLIWFVETEAVDLHLSCASVGCGLWCKIMRSKRRDVDRVFGLVLGGVEVV